MGFPYRNIVIIGSGVFGLSTAHALSHHFPVSELELAVPRSDSNSSDKHTQDVSNDESRTSEAMEQEEEPSSNSKIKITLISPGASSYGPTPLSASVDSSRIVRSDYAEKEYAEFAREAKAGWEEWKSRSQGEEEEALRLEGVHRSGVVYQGLKSSSSAAAPSSEIAAPPGAVTATSDDATPSNGKGKDYLSLAMANTSLQERVEPLSEKQIQELMQKKGLDGKWEGAGYVNWDAGWVNAEQALTTLWHEVKREGIVHLRDGIVKEILYRTEHDRSRQEMVTSVIGVRLDVADLEASEGDIDTTATDEQQLQQQRAQLVEHQRHVRNSLIRADLVIVAAGAWSASLVDLAGQAAARGQCMAYLSLKPDEASRLEGMPVVFDLKTGVFVIPPSKDRPKDGSSNNEDTAKSTLKIARHDYGYKHPILLQEAHSSRTIDWPELEKMPVEAEETLRKKLDELIPWLGMAAGREWEQMRMCWYSDTPSGDWLIDYHPRTRGLFIATGDSGHGFKFLPNLGKRIVKQVIGEEHSFREKWGWRGYPSDLEVWCEDGSRLGEKGRVV